MVEWTLLSLPLRSYCVGASSFVWLTSDEETGLLAVPGMKRRTGVLGMSDLP